jgi:geranylgeranyl diphosphate synthase, type I
MPCDTPKMVAERSPLLPPDVRSPLGRIEEVLHAFLSDRRAAFADLDPRAAAPVEEIERLVAAGGKRLRPLCCYWGYRAGGAADDGRIVRAAAALELLHTMAIVHDDLIDEAAERRGVASSHVAVEARARELGFGGDPAKAGAAGALLIGDLAAVFADILLLEAGFPSERLAAALSIYHRMREEMAAGQWLTLAGAGRDESAVARVAALKGGRYTVGGPILIGATLAGAEGSVLDLLESFASPLGEAFQLKDDLEDGDAPAGLTAADVDARVDRAVSALDPSIVGSEGAAALAVLAETVRMR